MTLYPDKVTEQPLKLPPSANVYFHSDYISIHRWKVCFNVFNQPSAALCQMCEKPNLVCQIAKSGDAISAFQNGFLIDSGRESVKTFFLCVCGGGGDSFGLSSGQRYLCRKGLENFTRSPICFLADLYF